jgi:hypothetical protein
MKLIIDSTTQEIELSDHAPNELRLDRADAIKLATALLLALNGKKYSETLDAIAQGCIDQDELEIA